jgi:glycosyltransferase involved in cell wall biosynthesis
MNVPADLSWELVLVDNNSRDDTRAVAEGFASAWNLSLRYIFELEQGISFARNAGVRAAHGEIIAFTDDDVIVHPDWLRFLSDTFETQECTGVGGKIVPVWTCEKPAWYVDKGPYKLNAAIVSFDLGDEPGEMKTKPFTANMAIKKEAFEKYGYFRTDIGLKGETRMPGHETEFCRRVVQGGGKFLYEPRAVVYHPVEPERTRKRYFQKWYFGFGRTSMREFGFPPGATLYFGVPRYLIRMLAGECLKWTLTFNPTRRFYYKLQACQILGEIYEARQTAKRLNRSKNGTPKG